MDWLTDGPMYVCMYVCTEGLNPITARKPRLKPRNIKYKRLAGSQPANDYQVQLHMFSVFYNYAGLDNSTILQFFSCLLTYVKYDKISIQ